jgi:hypothetical protein
MSQGALNAWDVRLLAAIVRTELEPDQDQLDFIRHCYRRVVAQ